MTKNDIMEEEKVRAIIWDELRKAFGVNVASNPDIEFLNTSEIAKILGYKNTRPIYALIESGVLRIGQEVQDRRSPASQKADYYFNKNACLKRLNTPPEKRAN